MLASSRPFVSLNNVIPVFRCGKEGQKRVASQIKTSKSFSPHFPTLILNVYSFFQRPPTFSYTSMARLPHKDAPTWGGASLADNSCKFGTRNLTTRLHFPLAIEDLFSGLHLSPAQARGIVLALLRISNSPAPVSEPTAGIPADDFDVLLPGEAGSDGIDHLLPDDVILITPHSSPLISPFPVHARPLVPRVSGFTSRTHSSPGPTASVAATTAVDSSAEINRAYTTNAAVSTQISRTEVGAPTSAIPASTATASPVTTTRHAESTYLNAAAAS